MEVGQKVYLMPIGNAARGIKDSIVNHIKEAEIEKVGNKFFYLKGYPRNKFGIQEMRDISDYSSNYVIYLSMQVIYDEMESNELLKDIRKILGDWVERIYH